jgi:hypothetical protein
MIPVKIPWSCSTSLTALVLVPIIVLCVLPSQLCLALASGINSKKIFFNRWNKNSLKMRRKMLRATWKGLLVHTLIDRTVRECSWITIMGLRLIKWLQRMEEYSNFRIITID